MNHIEYLSLGYQPIPIAPRDKFPTVDDWANPELDLTTLTYPKGYGTGLRTGHDGFCGLDVDIRNADIVKQLTDFLATHGVTVARVGLAPKTLFPVICHDITEKIISRKYVDHDGKVNLIEILSTGQQFVAQGIHPDTGKPYTWNADLPPLSDLTVVSGDVLQEMFHLYDLLAATAGWTIVASHKNPPKSQPTCAVQRGYNSTHRIEDILTRYGWTDLGKNRWTRPDKRSGVSATVSGNTMYCFTSSTQLNEACTYRPYEVVKLYSFDGNCQRMYDYAESEITARMAAAGFGSGERPEGASAVPLPEDYPTPFAFNKSDNRYYELLKPRAPGMVLTAFKKVYGPTVENWLIKPYPVITGMGYHPSEPVIYYDQDVQGNVLNNFVLPSHDRANDNTGQFLDLTSRIWDVHAEYVLDLLASIVQEPEKRIQVMPLLVSGFGAGKDTWIDYFKAAIGHWNCTQESLANIAGVGTSDWGNWCANSILCIVSEAETTGRQKYTLGAGLRDKITNSRLSVNIKSGSLSSRQVFTAIVGFSNLNESVVIPRGDRRIFIHRTDHQIKNFAERRQYFSQCRQEIDDPAVIGSIYNLLKTRKIIHDPYGHAPVTEYKTLLMQGSKEIEQSINEIIDSHPCDLITSQKLRSLISETTGLMINVQQYEYATKDLLTKANNGNKMRYQGSHAQRIYALRNPSKWMAHNPGSMRLELDRGGVDSQLSVEVNHVMNGLNGG
jgi:hypothetical protein